MWRISVFLCCGGEPRETELIFTLPDWSRCWQGEPLLLPEWWFVATRGYLACPHRELQLRASLQSWQLAWAICPCSSWGAVEAEQGQQSKPFDSQHERCPAQAAFGQPASCCADTLPWHDGTGRHKSAMGQRGSGCENQRTAPVEVPVILYIKLLDKTTAFIQLC